jgi:hypothetical protein
MKSPLSVARKTFRTATTINPKNDFMGRAFSSIAVVAPLPRK